MLWELDFLLGVDDEARQGALRFALHEGEPFLAKPQKGRIPPLTALPRLLAASEAIAADRESEEDLRLLLAPGSSLGGARPKASVIDAEALAIAKFPHQQDEISVVLWEAVALSLADAAGIRVPVWRAEWVAGRPVLLSRRFDRHGQARIPFLSAMSMLGANDNEPHSYLEIADALRRYGAEPREDLRHLWRRLVFNVLISNTDDRLRNHGFLWTRSTGWRLSPVYDLNPAPSDIRPRVLSTWIDLDDPSASLDLALQTAVYYGLTSSDAQRIAAEVAEAVSAWKRVAARVGISDAEIRRMASAFEHDDMQQALGIRNASEGSGG